MTDKRIKPPSWIDKFRAGVVMKDREGDSWFYGAYTGVRELHLTTPQLTL